MPEKKRKAVSISLDAPYDKDEDKIIIPAGMKRFSAIDYNGKYPIIFSKVAGVTKYENNINTIYEDFDDIDISVDEELSFPSDDYIDDVKNFIYIKLFAEKTNPYDSNAIRVMAYLATSPNKKPFREPRIVGYLPKELAKLLTEIKERYKMSYKAKVVKFKSNLNFQGGKMNFPCSIGLELTPVESQEFKSVPLHKVQNIAVKSMDEMKKILSKKR